MKRKQVGPKKAPHTVKKSPPSLVRVDKFDDGSETRTPLVEVIEQLLQQCGAAANSDEPSIRIAGRRRLRQIAEHIAATSGKQLLRSMSGRNNAQKPRRKRGASPKTKLLMRGLRCVQHHIQGITPETLCTILEAEPLTYDDDDIQLHLDGENIIISDLARRAAVKSATIKTRSLRAYMALARKT